MLSEVCLNNGVVITLMKITCKTLPKSQHKPKKIEVIYQQQQNCPRREWKIMKKKIEIKVEWSKTRSILLLNFRYLIEKKMFPLLTLNELVYPWVIIFPALHFFFSFYFFMNLILYFYHRFHIEAKKKNRVDSKWFCEMRKIIIIYLYYKKKHRQIETNMWMVYFKRKK